jgi:hypothetical protein
MGERGGAEQNTERGHIGDSANSAPPGRSVAYERSIKGASAKVLEYWPCKAGTVVCLVELIVADVCHLAVTPEASYREEYF